MKTGRDLFKKLCGHVDRAYVERNWEDLRVYHRDAWEKLAWDLNQEHQAHEAQLKAVQDKLIHSNEQLRLAREENGFFRQRQIEHERTVEKYKTASAGWQRDAAVAERALEELQNQLATTKNPCYETELGTPKQMSVDEHLRVVKEIQNKLEQKRCNDAEHRAATVGNKGVDELLGQLAGSVHPVDWNQRTVYQKLQYIAKQRREPLSGRPSEPHDLLDQLVRPYRCGQTVTERLRDAVREVRIERQQKRDQEEVVEQCHALLDTVLGSVPRELRSGLRTRVQSAASIIKQLRERVEKEDDVFLQKLSNFVIKEPGAPSAHILWADTNDFKSSTAFDQNTRTSFSIVPAASSSHPWSLYVNDKVYRGCRTVAEARAAALEYLLKKGLT